MMGDSFMKFKCEVDGLYFVCMALDWNLLLTRNREKVLFEKKRID